MARFGLIKSGIIKQIVEQTDNPLVPGNWQLLADGREAVGDPWPWPIPTPAPAPTTISSQEFWDRFTKQERILLDIAEQFNPSDTLAKQKTAAERRLRRRDIDRNGSITLTKPWVSLYVTDMETDGILAAGRAAQILVGV